MEEGCVEMRWDGGVFPLLWNPRSYSSSNTDSKIILMQTAPKLCKQFPTASEATTWQYCSSQVSMAP